MTYPTHVGFEQRVLARLKRLGLPSGACVTVGFSGGADSLALAAVLARLAPVADVRVLPVCVDHGLRPESAGDAAACRQLAAELKLPIVSVRLSPDDLARHSGVGVEEAARRERYVALCREAEAAGSTLVAVAHHREDQAETVLLHLLRGGGLHGARGMAELSSMTVPWWDPTSDRESRTIDVWRPFLDESRAAVRAYAGLTGLPPIADSSNDDPRFRRNRIRQEVLPLLRDVSPGADAALARYARIASAEDALLDDQARRALSRVRRFGPTLDARALSDEQPAVRRRVVLAWLHGFGVGDELSFDRIDAVLDAAARGRGGCKIEIGAGWAVVVTDGALAVRGPSDEREAFAE